MFNVLFVKSDLMDDAFMHPEALLVLIKASTNGYTSGLLIARPPVPICFSATAEICWTIWSASSRLSGISDVTPIFKLYSKVAPEIVFVVESMAKFAKST